MLIQEYLNLLNVDECNRIIKLAEESNIGEATVIGDNDSGYRTALSCWLETEDDIILSWIRDYISYETKLPVENQEGIHLVKYPVGGKYDPHHDYFVPDYELHNDFIGKSGNRTHSFLIYLNDDFEGGETKFIKQDRIVTPETGKGLLWTNTIDGEVLKESEHAGLPVTEGYKYILIIWVRENKFV